MPELIPFCLLQIGERFKDKDGNIYIKTGKDEYTYWRSNNFLWTKKLIDIVEKYVPIEQTELISDNVGDISGG